MYVHVRAACISECVVWGGGDALTLQYRYLPALSEALHPPPHTRPTPVGTQRACGTRGMQACMHADTRMQARAGSAQGASRTAVQGRHRAGAPHPHPPHPPPSSLPLTGPKLPNSALRSCSVYCSGRLPTYTVLTRSAPISSRLGSAHMTVGVLVLILRGQAGGGGGVGWEREGRGQGG